MKNKGFTMVELLAVIGILGIILVIAVPKMVDIVKNRKNQTFLIIAKNVIRQIEYGDNDFEEAYLYELNIGDIKVDKFDINRSKAYFKNNDVYIDLVGQEEYEGMYICDVSASTKAANVQNTPCESGGSSTKLACKAEYCYLFGSEIQSENGNYNKDIKTDWRDVKDGNGVQRPVFLKFKNDLSEKYTCTTYNIGSGEPTCISANAYNEYIEAEDSAKSNTEWGKMKTLLNAGEHCIVGSNQEYCYVSIGSVDWGCSFASGDASCYWTDGSPDVDSSAICTVYSDMYTGGGYYGGVSCGD